jgi:hypothetical protein
LRIEIPEGWIHGGNPSHRLRGTSVDRSSTPEDYHIGKSRNLRIEIPEGWIHGGDPGRRFRETGGNRSLTLEDWSTEEREV